MPPLSIPGVRVWLFRSPTPLNGKPPAKHPPPKTPIDPTHRRYRNLPKNPFPHFPPPSPSPTAPSATPPPFFPFPFPPPSTTTLRLPLLPVRDLLNPQSESALFSNGVHTAAAGPLLPRAAVAAGGGGGVDMCPTIVVAAESFRLHCFRAAGGGGGGGVESVELTGTVDWGCEGEAEEKGNWNCVYVVWLWLRTWVGAATTGRPWLKRIAGVDCSAGRPCRAWRVLAEVAVRENCRAASRGV